MPLLYILSILIAVSATDDRAYCAVRYARLCQEKGQHVGCQYPDSGPGESCERYTKIVFTDDLKNFILNYINRHRQKIAAGHEKVRGGQPIPKPDIMMYVEWDRELAHLAQRLADQCRFVHDECRATVRYPYAGQTVGEVRWRKSADSDRITAQKAIKKVLDAWWGEKRRVQPHQLTNPFRVSQRGIVWGHFSQLANWNLLAVGCGAVHHGPPRPRLLLVCDYSHTNMLGQKTISAGPMATCPPHTTRMPRSQFPLLCRKINYPVRHQDVDSSYDYNNYDDESHSLPDEAHTFPVEEMKSSTVMYTTKDAYTENIQHRTVESETVYPNIDIDDIQGPPEYNPKRTTVLNSRGWGREFKPRKQLKIKHGRYEPVDGSAERLDNQDLYGRLEEDDARNGGHGYENRPHGGEAVSVVPLRYQPGSNEVNPGMWKTKMSWFSMSSTELPQYKTSIVFIPFYNNRKATDPNPTSDVLTIRRLHYSTKETKAPNIIPKFIEKKATTHASRMPSDPSLMLDKEDVDQLYKDTGFKPNWTPKV